MGQARSRLHEVRKRYDRPKPRDIALGKFNIDRSRRKRYRDAGGNIWHNGELNDSVGRWELLGRPISFA